MSNVAHAKKKIEAHVMDKINSGEVKVRPKLYFVSLTALSIIALAVISGITAYLISLLTLWLRIQNASGPAYGARRNLTSLVDKFPWWAIILTGLSVLLIAFLVKHIGNLYKIRLRYLIAAILFIAIVLGFGLSYTQFPNLISGKQQTRQGQMHNQK
jgi:hypothetical protein